MKLTDEQIAEIEARCEAATKHAQLARYDNGGGRLAVFDGDNRVLVADFYHESDREFFEAARTDIPALVADLRETRELARRLAEGLKVLTEDVECYCVPERHDLCGSCEAKGLLTEAREAGLL